MRQYSLFILLFLLSSFLSADDQDIPDKPVETSLQSFKSNNKTYLAFTMRHKPKWHTYWKNPGDAGLPTKINIKGPKVKEIEWPSPKRYMEKGEILAYGYSNEITRFFEVQDNSDKDLSLQSNWLVCKHICIPGQISLKGKFKNKKISEIKNDFKVEESELKKRFQALPKKSSWPSNLDLKLVRGEKENQLAFFYRLSEKREINENSALLIPFSAPLITFKHEKLKADSVGLNAKMLLDWDGEYESPEVPLPKNGVFKSPRTFKFLFKNDKGVVSVIEKRFEGFQNENTKGFFTFFKSIGSKGDQGSLKNSESKEENKKGLLYYLIFAFLGGLILNIMPCVLPVISLKLFGLSVHSDESPKMILKHNIFYTLGVLSTFFTLALTIVLLKSAGQYVGWGFQLQSPLFVALMIIVLFVMSLNLFGLFEFSTPGGRSLGSVQLKSGVLGDFLGGVLATILSTPCSAPFLGTALTFAFTSSTLTIFLMFMMIGLGLSFPFLLTGFFPKMIAFIPRPGMWMNKVKVFLGLTLSITVLWLADVFHALSGRDSLVMLGVLLSLIFLAFALKKKTKLPNPVKTIFFLFPFLLFLNIYFTNGFETSSEDGHLIAEKQAKGLDWIPWSEKKMSALAQEKKAVFIDFTAKWCVTCKVNEKLVIETDEFKELVREKKISLLLGDWTKHDPVIGEYLKRQGLVGVPAYFIQKPNGALIKLGETVSIAKIKSHL